MNTVVIGSGVIGLTTATLLQEAGYRVTLLARELPRETTSDVAGAVWCPARSSPERQAREWAETSFQIFRELAGNPRSGVTLTRGRKLFHRRMGFPWWTELAEARRLDRNQLEAGCETGFEFTVPVIEMSRFLGEYLTDRFQFAGGRIERRELHSLDEAWGQSKLLVNCSGLGAKLLCADERLYPARGQVTRLTAISSREVTLCSDHPHGMIYVVPRSEDCIIGGVSERDRWSLEISTSTAQATLERCSSWIPELGTTRVLEHRVGLRPMRDAIRLELERSGDGRLLVHNYGHGGSGVTLSWGSARHVLRLLKASGAGLEASLE